MRNAVIRIEALVVCCPFCYEPLSEPGSGSQMWTEADIATAVEHHTTVMRCRACGCAARVKLPKSVRTGPVPSNPAAPAATKGE